MRSRPAALLMGLLLGGCAAGNPTSPTRSLCEEALPSPASPRSAAADPGGRAPPPMDERVLSDALLHAFERAVAAKDRKQVLALLDPDYREKEFEDYYRGDTAAFLDDFFCGRTLDSTQTLCVPFGSVTGLERTGLSEGEDGFAAEYLIRASPQPIRATLKALPKRKVTFGLLGARGFTQVE